MIQLRLSMIGTVFALIAASSIAFAVILSLIGSFDIIGVVFMTALFNIGQWLISPYLIGSMYHVKEAPKDQYSGLYHFIESISRRTGLKMPKVMIADLPVPNAFAYGSPLAGSRVAVTKGLLQNLEKEEVEAVLGHELGHLKHRDVQTTMFASILPAIFYFLGYSLMQSSTYGGYQRDRRSGAGGALVGMVSMAAYWVLNLFVMGLSRIREYYADQFSANNVEDGVRKLSEALAKISKSASTLKRQKQWRGNVNGFKALMIADPDQADVNALQTAQYFHRDAELVQRILQRRITILDQITELFSTHPNIVKRLQALQKLR